MSTFKKVVVNVSDEPQIVIGERFDDGFTVEYIDRRFVLYNSDSEALLQFGKKEISSKSIKQKLLDILKDADTVDQTLAACAQVTSAEKIKEEERKNEQKAKFRHRPAFPYNGVLYEQCFDGKKVFFATYDLVSKEVKYLSSCKVSSEDEEIIILPINNTDVQRKLVYFPSKVEEYGDLQTLIMDITNFLNYWHEPVSEKDRLLDAYYVLLTWFKDLVPQIPYRRMLAPYGSGKSSWLDALGSICYRGIITTGASTVVSLIRTLDLWRGTAIIDEADFSSTEANAFIIKILTVGYDRKTGYYRKAADQDSKEVTDAFVYGPKLLATRFRYEDMALESRCLTVQGKENKTPKPPFRMEKFEQEAQTLRNKLLKWRFDNYAEIKSKASHLESPNISTIIYGNNQQVSRRIQQIILPLSLFGGEEHRKRLKELAEASYATLTSLDDDYLLEQQAKDAILRLIQNNELKQTENYYELNLTKLSYMLLNSETTDIDVYRNPTFGTLQKGEVESMSKKLKRILETNLAFELKIKHKIRYFRVPKYWYDSAEKEKGESNTESHTDASSVDGDVANSEL